MKLSSSINPKLNVNIAGVNFKNPVIPASGCFGFGREYEALYPISTLGGIALKGTTLHKRDGNPVPRVAETYAGMLNSVGLQNHGIEQFAKHDLPYLKTQDVVLILNLAGSSPDEYVEVVRRACMLDIDMVELNISCPNVKEGGVAFGVSCDSAASVVSQVRKVCTKPLIVKLSPNVTSIKDIAMSVESAGADAISLINTLLGMRIDINSRKPILKNNVGGISGPCIFPLAVRMVWEVANCVNIPVIGMGGITTADDAVEMMMAGASAVQVGAALFNDPFAPVKIIDGLSEYVEKNNLNSISDIVGTVIPH